MSPFVDRISSPIMRSLSTGQILSQADLPAGALYPVRSEIAARGYYGLGPDGLSIFCILPDRHHWGIDGRARNCTLPSDNEHRCWIRHGTVGDRLTVDKNGKTCNAGAGSIVTLNLQTYVLGKQPVQFTTLS